MGGTKRFLLPAKCVQRVSASPPVPGAAQLARGQQRHGRGLEDEGKQEARWHRAWRHRGKQLGSEPPELQELKSQQAELSPESHRVAMPTSCRQAFPPGWIELLFKGATSNFQPDIPKDSEGQLYSLFHTSVVQGRYGQHHTVERKHPAAQRTHTQPRSSCSQVLEELRSPQNPHGARCPLHFATRMKRTC